MYPKLNVCLIILMIVALLFDGTESAKGGRGKGKGKGKGKLSLPYKNVIDFSKIVHKEFHPDGARIVSASHFMQVYRLGFKILLVCLAEGDPLPLVVWMKDDKRLPLLYNTHVTVTQESQNMVKSKLEIDPAKAGDQGLFTCLVTNKWAGAAKNFKVEYTY